MLTLETAVERVLAALPGAQGERVPLAAAVERVAFAEVAAAVDLPAFDNSAMDGFAVRAAEVAGATSAQPIALRLQMRIAAGDCKSEPLQPGECARIFTGAPMPPGADAVVMQEDTRMVPANPATVLICDSAQPGENLRRRGDDLERGQTILRAGEVVTPGILALLAATGGAAVEVARRPVVGLVATGSELREPGSELAPGQIYESNRAALGPLVAQAGGVAEVFPLVTDSLTATAEALAQAFRQCDIVVTSGGVSVGETDFVKPAFEALGGKVEFWKVAMRPGKPFVFGRWGQKYLFGLPGNPVSAFVTFLLLVRPALRRWQGAREVFLPTFPAVLAEEISNPADRRHFVRVRVDTNGRIYSAGKQASHALSSLAAANGLVDVPPRTNLAAGAVVAVLDWR